ncbi:hypothetical protein M427DRAFT_133801 [Gonapodya prolifera JEL478]|uniref:Uncharacterized protein n=1 Tax=Gonapodya prolifera (strain JEL478) TaxID=1344416 RepID=A0A139AJQ1_GONPJ|nr:hypothetical protein M427DRAFT_133801 [Gonapodya prolifera JEL478]|eukprot:KXS17036.1 hypothetical protein M427DRAFT_133801 [Gonapodya prolifera JEL478]
MTHLLPEAQDLYTEACSLLDAVDDGLSPEVDGAGEWPLLTLKFGDPSSAAAVSAVASLLQKCILNASTLTATLSGTAGTLPPNSSRSHSNPHFLFALALCELGEIHELRTGDRNRARDLYSQAVVAFPDGVEAPRRLAKMLYSEATTEPFLSKVEKLLKNAVTNAERLETELDGDDDDETDVLGLAMHDPPLVQRELSFVPAVRDRLALLYCQTGRDDLAATQLMAGGYEWRLGREILNYPSTLSHSKTVSKPSTQSNPATSPTVESSLVRAVDNSLPPAVLAHLREVFRPSSTFWTAHGYNEHQSNGYFSYVVDLRPFLHPISPKPPPTLFHASLLHLLRTASHLFPTRASSVTHAEFWAHCRPHTSGHQFHFDSENEGVGPGGGPRHPPCTAIVVLSDGSVGGPTVVTEQVLRPTVRKGKKAKGKRESQDVTKTGLADSAFAVGPAPGRVTIFRADVLHGVVPGKPPTPVSSAENPSFSTRRVSFMVGFWDGIKAREPPVLPDGRARPSASMPFPPAHSSHSWYHDTILSTPAGKLPPFNASKFTPVEPVKMPGAVWERVGGAAANESGSRDEVPDYEYCFQGF